MAVWHEGMDKAGFHEGRADDKASHGGHEIFGKSGGGNGGICTNLIASPTQPIAQPPKERD